MIYGNKQEVMNFVSWYSTCTIDCIDYVNYTIYDPEAGLLQAKGVASQTSILNRDRHIMLALLSA